MKKILLLEDWDGQGKSGEELTKSEDWVKFHARKIGVIFEVVSSKPTETKIASESESAEMAYGKLSEGEKDSIRKGFKSLVLRKEGWILKDCSNKAQNEIHISIPNRELEIKSAKDSSIERAKSEIAILGKFKEILRLSISGKMDEFNISLDGDSEILLEMVEKLSLGFTEVEVLKAENSNLRKRLGGK